MESIAELHGRSLFEGRLRVAVGTDEIVSSLVGLSGAIAVKPREIAMSKITSCLWFDGRAEEAARYYVGLFPNSKLGRISLAPDGIPRPAGSVLTVEFELDGAQFLALNGGPEFKFSEAVSFQIECRDQAEVDRYWEALTSDGGEPGPCGWCKDRFGLSWQVAPSALPRLMNDPDPAKANRVTAAMMRMGKLDVAKLEAAAVAA